MLFLVLSIALPSPAFALRQVGLEESEPAKREIQDALTPLASGLEEVRLDKRLTGNYTYDWRLDEIGALGLGDKSLKRFQQLYGKKEDNPRPGDIPRQTADGDPAGLARWRAKNHLDDPVLQKRIRRVQEMHPPDPSRVIELGPQLETYRRFIQEHPESNFVWLGVKEYETPSHSFKYRQFIDAFFTDILDVAQKGRVRPKYVNGAAMFSSGNAILGALETVKWLKAKGWLPADFKITLIAMSGLAKNKREKIERHQTAGRLDRIIFVKPQIALEYQRALKKRTVKKRFKEGILVDAVSLPNALEDINQVLLLVDWWADKEKRYHLQASNSISAVVGGASLYEDIRMARKGDYLDYVVMTFGGAIPVVGQALAAMVRGDSTQILGVRSTIPTESVADSVQINNALPIGRKGLKLFGSKRLRLVEAPELAWIKAVVEFHKAGILVEPTAVGPAALIFTIMANDPEFFERFSQRHGRPMVIATVLSGDNYDQDVIESAKARYQQFHLDRLDPLRFPASGLEEDADFEERLDRQILLALERIHANVYPPGAIAAASETWDHLERGGRVRPHYWFEWPRDAFATLLAVIAFKKEVIEFKEGLEQLIFSHNAFFLETMRKRKFPASVQRINVLDGSLPEQGGDRNWSIQPDGPGLGALALATMGKDLTTEVRPLRKGLVPLLNWFLREIVWLGRDPDRKLGGLPQEDAWEQVPRYRSLYTEMVQMAGFKAAAEFAEQRGWKRRAGLWREKANEWLEGLNDFWDARRGYFRAHYREDRKEVHLGEEVEPRDISGIRLNKPDNLDAINFGGWLYAFGPADYPEGWSPREDHLLTAFMKLDETFREIYAINRAAPAGALLWGRFRGDTYNGEPSENGGFNQGHPWPLTTLWRIRFLYRYAQELLRVSPRDVSLSEKEAAFLRSLGVETSQTAVSTMAEEVMRVADRNLTRLLGFVPKGQTFSEQIDSATGDPRGARDLTWANAELILTHLDREELQEALTKSAAGLEEVVREHAADLEEAQEKLLKEIDLRIALPVILNEKVLGEREEEGLWPVLDRLHPTLGSRIILYLDRSFALRHADKLYRFKRKDDNGIRFFTTKEAVIRHLRSLEIKRAVYYTDESDETLLDLKREAGQSLQLSGATYDNPEGFIRQFVALSFGRLPTDALDAEIVEWAQKLEASFVPSVPSSIAGTTELSSTAGLEEKRSTFQNRPAVREVLDEVLGAKRKAQRRSFSVRRAGLEEKWGLSEVEWGGLRYLLGNPIPEKRSAVLNRLRLKLLEGVSKQERRLSQSLLVRLLVHGESPAESDRSLASSLVSSMDFKELKPTVYAFFRGLRYGQVVDALGRIEPWSLSFLGLSAEGSHPADAPDTYTFDDVDTVGFFTRTAGEILDRRATLARYDLAILDPLQVQHWFLKEGEIPPLDQFHTTVIARNSSGLEEREELLQLHDLGLELVEMWLSKPEDERPPFEIQVMETLFPSDKPIKSLEEIRDFLVGDPQQQGLVRVIQFLPADLEKRIPARFWPREMSTPPEEFATWCENLQAAIPRAGGLEEQFRDLDQLIRAAEEVGTIKIAYPPAQEQLLRKRVVLEARAIPFLAGLRQIRLVNTSRSLPIWVIPGGSVEQKELERLLATNGLNIPVQYLSKEDVRRLKIEMADDILSEDQVMRIDHLDPNPAKQWRALGVFLGISELQVDEPPFSELVQIISRSQVFFGTIPAPHRQEEVNLNKGLNLVKVHEPQRTYLIGPGAVGTLEVLRAIDPTQSQPFRVIASGPQQAGLIADWLSRYQYPRGHVVDPSLHRKLYQAVKREQGQLSRKGTVVVVRGPEDIWMERFAKRANLAEIVILPSDLRSHIFDIIRGYGQLLEKGVSEIEEAYRKANRALGVSS